jgi:hypothetical protein
MPAFVLAPVTPADPWAFTLPMLFSLLALSISVVALTWNVISFFLAGALVRVRLELVVHYERKSSGVEKLASILRPAATRWTEIVQPKDWPTYRFKEATTLRAFVSVIVHNGRAPLSIADYLVQIGGTSFGYRAADPELIRLEPHAQARYESPLGEIQDRSAAAGQRYFRGVVRLATGRTKKSRFRRVPHP